MMSKLSERDMLVTLATMAVIDDDLSAHDIIEALRSLGHGSAVEEARRLVSKKPKKRGPRKTS